MSEKASDVSLIAALVSIADAIRNNNAIVAQSSLGSGNGTTTSGSFTTSLSGQAQVTVSLSVPASGKLQISFSSWMTNTSGASVVGFTLSGANTLAAANSRSFTQPANANSTSGAYSIVLTGLTPGSTTVTLAYFVTAGTGNFANQSLIVSPVFA